MLKEGIGIPGQRSRVVLFCSKVEHEKAIL
jgi:hypothetical protein